MKKELVMEETKELLILREDAQVNYDEAYNDLMLTLKQILNEKKWRTDDGEPNK